MLSMLRDIRAAEVAKAAIMARIRAINIALYFAIMPLVSFVTFAVVGCPYNPNLSPDLFFIVVVFVDKADMQCSCGVKVSSRGCSRKYCLHVEVSPVAQP